MKPATYSSLTLTWQTLVLWEVLFTALEYHRKKFRAFGVLSGFRKTSVSTRCCGPGEWFCPWCYFCSHLSRAKRPPRGREVFAVVKSRYGGHLESLRTCVLEDWKCSWLKPALTWIKLPQREVSRFTQGTSSKTQTIKSPPATETRGMLSYIIFHTKCNCRLTFIEKTFIQARYA